MKKGFTLVELLGTIILLGLLSFVVAVPIIARINKNSEKINNATIKMLRESVIQYIEKNNNDFRSKKPGTIYYITLSELDYNAGGIENLYKNNPLDDYSQVEVEIDSDGDYEVTILETPVTNLKDIYSAGKYVLYNGIIWKMISEDTTSKTIKLASNEFVGSVQKGPESNFSNTYVYKWLNNYFISMLNNTNIIRKTSYGDTTSLVGVLTKSEDQANPKSGYVYYVLNNSNLVNNDSSTNNASLIMPVISVFDGAVVTGGTGTENNPYILNDNQNNQAGSSLRTADISIGQYIQFENKKYRIIEYGNSEVKLISTFFEGQDIYASGETFNLSNGAGHTLNSTNVSNYMKMNNVYVGSFYYTDANYENTTMKMNNAVYKVYKALPKIGELFTVPISSDSYWTLNVLNTTNAYVMTTSGLQTESYSAVKNLLYTTYISANNIIESGHGTSSDPFILQ